MARSRRDAATYRLPTQCRYCERFEGPALRSADQLLLPGIAPRWSETDEGREWLRLMQRYGIARVLRRAHQIRPALISRLMRRAA